MPLYSNRICSRGGCHHTVKGEKRYCEAHTQHEPGKFHGFNVDKKTRQFYNSRAWRVLTRLFIADNPFCMKCNEQGRLELSKHSDHIKPIRTHWHLRLEQDNLQALCIKCHSTKTAKRDG